MSSGLHQVTGRCAITDKDSRAVTVLKSGGHLLSLLKRRLVLLYCGPLLLDSKHECEALLLHDLLNKLRRGIVHRPVAGVQCTLA